MSTRRLKVVAGAQAFNLLACTSHSRFYCHVNASGIHVDPRHCTCNGLGPGYCPIDLHNPALAKAIAENFQKGQTAHV